MKKIIFLSILISFLSCKKEEEKIVPKYEYVNKEVYEEPTEIDFYNFKHYLDNEYAFDVKITNIKVIEHKGVFEEKKEKFGLPEKVNGNSIIIYFDITNPYSRSMQIPFPEYYQIASKEFENLEGYGYIRNLDTYASFASSIKTKKGILLNKTGKYNDEGRLLVDFEPNETKSFMVKFTKPFPLTIEKIIFVAFNKHVTKQVANSSDLEGEELERYLADKCTTYGLVIDLKSKKIVDLITMNQ